MSALVMNIDRRGFIAGASAALLSVPAFAADKDTRAPSGRSSLFDNGWRFRRGEGAGYENVGFDDSSWRSVDLPHDWSIEDLQVEASQSGEASAVVGPFSRKAVGGVATGFTMGGEGWYRKTFAVEPAPDQQLEVLFDGIYANSDIWINGHLLGHHPNGYTPVSFDLTPHLSPTGRNVLAVRVRNLGENSRWYSGSGIYRHVWLDRKPKASRIARWGIGVTTRRLEGSKANLEIETRFEHMLEGTSILSRIRDANGHIVWQSETSGTATVRQEATIPAVRPWTPDTPYLYVLETTARLGGRIIDRTETPFGVRIVAFVPGHGLTLNGKSLKLRGGCIHHDNGLLGAMAFDAAEERKVRIMKARGFNAVRASHNPFSPAFLDACDRLGLMVIAEAFDMWRWPKNPQDYSVDFDANWRSDLTKMVLSERNHPSVIMWSIGNEIPHRNEPAGVKLQWELANAVHALDPSRPVTAAINDFQGRQVIPSQATARSGRAGKPDQASTVFLDVAGYNYKVSIYEREHAAFPERIIYGSESFSKDMFQTWEIADRSTWLIGDFVWTAIDYLGEAGLGGSAYASAKYPNAPAAPASWPWVVAACGETDLIGHQKGASLARDVVWGLSPVEIAVQKPVPAGKVEVPRLWGWLDERANWTWAGAEGMPLGVAVYTRGDSVQLRLNGATVEQKAVPRGATRVGFTVPYAPGTLEAVAFAGGREIGRRSLTSAGKPAEIRMAAEQTKLRADTSAIAYFPLEIVDAGGRRVGDLQTKVQISIDGPAVLIALGSAIPTATGSFQQPTAQTWDGRALAIIRSTGKSGLIRIRANGDGLQAAVATIRAI